MKKISLILAGGFFPQTYHNRLLDEALCYVMREIEAGRSLRTDFSVFDLPLPNKYHPLGLISRDFWQSFPSEFDYYSALTEDADFVIVLALPHPEHRQRINLISELCDMGEPDPIPLSIHLL